MKENITLISVNAQVKQLINETKDIRVFSDMDIFQENEAYLFIYQLEIGKSQEDAIMSISMVYRVKVSKKLDEAGLKECLEQIHPYLLEIVDCLLNQCLLSSTQKEA